MAKKSLGQNFLKDPKIIKKVIDAAEPFESDLIVEIGPGKGALTTELLSRGVTVLAIEADLELLPTLRQQFAAEIQREQLHLIHGDVRLVDENLFKQYGETYDLVANIPYYLTGLLFRKFLETNHQPQKLTFIVQREVADRIMMRDEKGSMLSMAIRAYGDPKSHGTIKKRSFTPAPKVDSAIISISNISKDNFADISEDAFFETLHAGFAHKRKKLLSNLADLYEKSAVTAGFAELDLDENIRAERITIDQWLDLTQILAA